MTLKKISFTIPSRSILIFPNMQFRTSGKRDFSSVPSTEVASESEEYSSEKMKKIHKALRNMDPDTFISNNITRIDRNNENMMIDIVDKLLELPGDSKLAIEMLEEMELGPKMMPSASSVAGSEAPDDEIWPHEDSAHDDSEMADEFEADIDADGDWNQNLGVDLDAEYKSKFAEYSRRREKPTRTRQRLFVKRVRLSRKKMLEDALRMLMSRHLKR
jgi:hypothetical protein